MNVGACACLPITAAMSRLDLRIGHDGLEAV